MNRVAVAVLGLTLAASAASAQQRPYTPALTCAAVKAIVARQGAVVLATSPHAYEKVYADSGACRDEVTAAPAFEPSIDDPNCFAGYRCQQRNNGNLGGR
ncbi:hypothetical protein [Methylobacterium gnaphalii]|uniref:Uncharacterized protein n=1 Tax=Methylobacterium gnaphalii TaxID=1010610 RepID=A0A512JIH8_9HYPH|nr:hypothetical protein [Methylobacterium gnaphalii]GEP09765.1 hypothetical protein MGN01_16100 [Methylobacterium gnaphalii]GJD67319.1 hypothetical protein MMMDOFMJ_0233 [Methylobacterium gnaphalii]GLS51359.1 hypothetical protein GCM10007885_42160 [Methylobacterium gnaphalii]